MIKRKQILEALQIKYLWNVIYEAKIRNLLENKYVDNFLIGLIALLISIVGAAFIDITRDKNKT